MASFSGQLSGYDALPQPDRLRILTNIGRATQADVGAALALARLRFLRSVGRGFCRYGMVVGSLLIGIGMPQAYTLIGGDKASSKATGADACRFPAVDAGTARGRWHSGCP
jgi:hypothetical protein